MRSYDISFPRQPVEAVLARLKAAGLRYVRPLDPFGMGHCGSAGIWRGFLTPQRLVDLQLPLGTRVR